MPLVTKVKITAIEVTATGLSGDKVTAIPMLESSLKGS